MTASEEFWKGVDACIAGDPCPENASEEFSRGFGMEYAAGESGIDLEKLMKREETV